LDVVDSLSYQICQQRALMFFPVVGVVIFVVVVVVVVVIVLVGLLYT